MDYNLLNSMKILAYYRNFINDVNNQIFYITEDIQKKNFYLNIKTTQNIINEIEQMNQDIPCLLFINDFGKYILFVIIKDKITIHKLLNIYDFLDNIYLKNSFYYTDFILILINEETDKIIEDLKKYETESKDLYGHIFYIKELLIEPTNNIIVSKCKLASVIEINDLNNTNIDINKLPRILMKDIIRRIYKFNLNEIISVESKYGLYYRIVKQ
jgi:hypothetical protein